MYMPGSPAYEQGLNTGDYIAAIDDHRGSKNFVDARVAEKKPGDVIHLTIFRNDLLRTIDIKLGSQSGATYRIVAVDKPGKEQKKTYQAWLGTPFSQ